MYPILYLCALFMVQIWPSLAFSTCRRAGFGHQGRRPEREAAGMELCLDCLPEAII